MEEEIKNSKEEMQNNENKIQDNYLVLDTTYFIRMKPLNLTEGLKYITTDFIVREIRDEKAREFYELNKNFVEIKNPTRESMRYVSNFAKLSNDLQNLSIPDLSILSLGYELIKNLGQEDLLKKEPMKYEVVETVKAKEKKKIVEETNESTDDGFVKVKAKNIKPKREKYENRNLFNNNDDDGWITPQNMEAKINKFVVEKDKEEKENEKLNSLKVSISSADFTVQNVSLKMGIPIVSIDGMKIRKIKNYVLKCYSCSNFLFDTSKMFCDDCGYNTLMKIACSINSEGTLKIYDKKPESRNRGTQYDLPKPSLDKKGVVYILSEDQIPKKKFEYNLEKDLEKILDNYESYKDFNPYKITEHQQNTSKRFVWGYPKKNPNVPKKYYSKNQKK